MGTVGGEATAGGCGDDGPGQALERTVSKEGTGESRGAAATVSGSHLALLGDTAAQGTFFLTTSTLGRDLLWKEPSW